MRIHCLQHVPFEGLGIIEEWAFKKKSTISSTKFYANYETPDLNSFDWLIIMGGPMGIYQEDKYPWLKEEKKLIEDAIKNEKIVIGICLGAQLVASVLGAKVYKNSYKEIGWYPVRKLYSLDNKLINAFPDEFYAFHWHGDTFDIPDDAVHFAASAVCRNQAFLYNNRVLGLQFHIESTEKSIKELIINCADELTANKFVQTRLEIIENTELNVLKANRLLYEILDTLA